MMEFCEQQRTGKAHLSAAKVKSQIDFFLVAKFLCNYYANRVDTKRANAPNHKAVKLSLHFSNVTRGSGLWKLNNRLLKDNEFVELFISSYPFITEIKGSNRKIVAKAITNENEELYSSCVDGVTNAFEAFTQGVNIAKLFEEEKNYLDGNVTVDECKKVLKSLQNGKFPGHDGFTIEFSKQFFGLLRQDLVDCFNAAYESGEMLISQHTV